MNIAVRHSLTVDEYLTWAAAQGEQPRAELVNGQIVPMPAERAIHNRVKGTVYVALVAAVKAARLSCEAFTDGMAIPIDEYTAYEPDALVRCGIPLASDVLTVTDPIIV